MFVIEDPGKRRSERAKYLQRSAVTSYLSSKFHERRRTESQKGTSHVPKPTPIAGRHKHRLPKANSQLGKSPASDSTAGSDDLAAWQLSTHKELDAYSEEDDDELREALQVSIARPQALQLYVHGNDEHAGRCLQYFRERTAFDFTGYHESIFWRQLALQAACDNLSIKHALVSLGAFHEMVELPDSNVKRCIQKQASELHARKALVTASQQLSRMNITAVLTTYIALAMVTLFVSEFKYFKVVEMEDMILEQINSHQIKVSTTDALYVKQYLEPIINPQRAKAATYVDMVYCLKRTPASSFHTEQCITIPERFTSIEDARELLETLLEWTTYAAKTTKLELGDLPEEATLYFDLYLMALEWTWHDSSLSERDRCRLALLKVSLKLGFMMIRNMNVDEDDLLFFDAYIPLFAETAECFRRVLNHINTRSSVNLVFGTDAGLLTLIGHCVRWCRDPAIRRDLCDLLRRSQRREGVEGAVVLAQIGEALASLEESNKHSLPRTCHDISLSKRVRITELRFWIMRSIRMQVAIHPFGPDDFRDLWLDHRGCGSILDERAVSRGLPDPDMIAGLGYTSMLDSSNTDRYYTVKNPRFFFPIPTV